MSNSSSSNRSEQIDAEQGGKMIFRHKVELNQLKNIRIQIRRHYIADRGNSGQDGPLLRTIENPDNLVIHRADEGLKPIFERDDVKVNTIDVLTPTTKSNSDNERKKEERWIVESPRRFSNRKKIPEKYEEGSRKEEERKRYKSRSKSPQDHYKHRSKSKERHSGDKYKHSSLSTTKDDLDTEEFNRHKHYSHQKYYSRPSTSNESYDYHKRDRPKSPYRGEGNSSSSPRRPYKSYSRYPSPKEYRRRRRSHSYDDDYKDHRNKYGKQERGRRTPSRSRSKSRERYERKKISKRRRSRSRDAPVNEYVTPILPYAGPEGYWVPPPPSQDMGTRFRPPIPQPYPAIAHTLYRPPHCVFLPPPTGRYPPPIYHPHNMLTPYPKQRLPIYNNRTIRLPSSPQAITASDENTTITITSTTSNSTEAAKQQPKEGNSTADNSEK